MPLIAITTGYIAYQQYHINKQKLKLDLYEKRYRIFKETKKLLHKINQDGAIDTIELRDFGFNTNDKVFLFNEDIVEFIEEIKRKAIDISFNKDEIEKAPDLVVRNLLREEKHTLTRWFTSEYINIESRFLIYLDFKDL